jgi:hypothetical protein
MGFFDAMTGFFDDRTNRSIKIAVDGQKLYFPFGAMGRGYVIASEADIARLRWRDKALFIGAILTTPIACSLSFPIGMFVVAAYSICAFCWELYALHRMQPANERRYARLSLREILAAKANVCGLEELWMLVIAALAFVAGGLFLLHIDPNHWLGATAAIVFSGAGAFVFGCMLILRDRTAT